MSIWPEGGDVNRLIFGVGRGQVSGVQVPEPVVILFEGVGKEGVL